MGTLNPEAVGEWFEAEAGSMVLYARQWLDHAHAEDVVQEAFIRLLQHEVDEEHVKGWLYRTVRNLVLNRFRGSERRRRHEAAACSETNGWFTAHPGIGIDARLAESVLRTLPPDEREIVTLRVWGGLTLEQIASVLDMSAASVFRKHRDALEKMRNRLEKPCLTTIC
jgi:RNA polymerase sigma-70 factor (ECF subfamily)